MSLSKSDYAAASEKLAILHRADTFTTLLTLPAWKDIYGLHVAWVEKYRAALLKVNTAEPAVALEALRQWQLAEEFLKLEADFINHTLQQADELRGTTTLHDAMLMEQYQNEQHDTSDGNSGGNRGGY